MEFSWQLLLLAGLLIGGSVLGMIAADKLIQKAQADASD